MGYDSLNSRTMRKDLPDATLPQSSCLYVRRKATLYGNGRSQEQSDTLGVGVGHIDGMRHAHIHDPLSYEATFGLQALHCVALRGSAIDESQASTA